MSSAWSAAPRWLRTLCLLGPLWLIAGLVVGVPLLVKPGPGLPIIMLGAALFASPWVLLLLRAPKE